ncbi:MAG: dTMP kinase [Sulfuriferula sp.]|nr:dTMP kinase [Sulfuriferula sp.]
MDSKRGAFVSLEGPDGSGKTTHMGFLCEALRERGYRVIETRQPGGSPTAEVIRKAVLGTELNEPMDAVTEAMLYAASRRQVLKSVIEPGLAAGAVIVSDRWADSSFAYQGWARGIMKEFVAIRDVAHKDFWPDVTVFFDVTLEESLARMAGRVKDYNRLNNEALAFRKRCFEGYQSLISGDVSERMVIVDSMRTIAEIQQSIHKYLDGEFAEKFGHLRTYPR